MEDLSNKIDNGGATAQGQLPSSEWNQPMSELKNAIESIGLSLAEADLFQLVKTISQYAVAGQFFTGGGIADAYTVAAIAPAVAPPNLVAGVTVEFIIPATNTGASTIAAFGGGAVAFEFFGAAMPAGKLVAGNKIRAYHDGSVWQLVPFLNQLDFVDMKSGRKNYIINGNFDIWQRGTNFVDPDSVYTSDRWLVDLISAGAGTLSRQAFALGQTDVPNEPEFFLRADTTTVRTAAVGILRQRIEGVRTLAGKSVMVSFWAKVDSAKTLDFEVRQNFGTGGSPSAPVTVLSQSINITTSWTKFEIPVTFDSLSGKTLGTNGDDYVHIAFEELSGFTTFTFDLAQVQVEEGSVATDFEFRPIAEELVLCQRYFQKTYSQGVSPGSVELNNTAHEYGHGASISGAEIEFRFATTMRVAPTVLPFSPATGVVGKFRNETAGADVDATNTRNGDSSTTMRTTGNSVDDDLYTVHITVDAEL